MNTLHTIITAVIAISLTGYIALFEWDYKGSEAPEFKRYLFNLSPKEINHLTITRKNGKKINFEKKDKTWFLQSPLNCKADQEILKKITTMLPRFLRSNAIPEELQKADEKYGLENPNITLDINYTDMESGKAKSSVLLFGNPTTNQQKIFARIKDEKYIYVLSIKFFKLLLLRWETYRFKYLLDINHEKINHISFVNDNEKWVIGRRGFKWYLLEPQTWELNAKTVKEFIYDLSLLRIERYVENDLSKKSLYGLNKPKIVISLKNNDQNSQSLALIVGASRGGYTFLQNNEENFIYGISSEKLMRHLPQLRLFRKLDVFSFKSHEITRIKVTNSKNNFILEKNNKNKWIFPELKGEFPDQDQIDYFIEEIAITFPEFFINNKKDEDIKTNRKIDKLKITLTNLQDQEQTLYIGKPVKGWFLTQHLKYFRTKESAESYLKQFQLKESELEPVKERYYAKRDKFSQVFAVDKSVRELINIYHVHFRMTNIHEWGLNNIYEISREMKGQKQIFRRMDLATNWIQYKPYGAKVDNSKATLLAATLSYFSVKRWIHPHLQLDQLQKYDLHKPLLSLTFSFNFKKFMKPGDFSKFVKKFNINKMTYKLLIGKEAGRSAFYACLFSKVDEKEFILSPNLFTLSKKIVLNKMMAKLLNPAK